MLKPLEIAQERVREQFEAWIKANWPNQLLDRFSPGPEDGEGEYTGFTVQHCWEAWKASRAAVVVEMPPEPKVPEDPEEAIDDSHMDSYHSAVRMRKACAKSVTAAGLQVKP